MSKPWLIITRWYQLYHKVGLEDRQVQKWWNFNLLLFKNNSINNNNNRLFTSRSQYHYTKDPASQQTLSLSRGNELFGSILIQQLKVQHSTPEHNTRTQQIFCSFMLWDRQIYTKLHTHAQPHTSWLEWLASRWLFQ